MPRQGDAAAEFRAASGSAWSKYSSIENCHNKKAAQGILDAVAASECEWVAVEKVHGANFAFETDGQRIGHASRNRPLGPGADFMNFAETMPKYHPFVLEAFRLARVQRPELRRLVIYGEYFGGFYPPHKSEPGLKKVQGGVAYSPGHHFFAFDVSLDGSFAQGGQSYMDFDDARQLLLDAGFPLVAAPLQRGPLQELMSFDVEAFETTIPAQLGHPLIDSFRTAEGVVLRPAREIASCGGRAILKKKAVAFWESTNQHGMAARVAQLTGQTRSPSQAGVLSEACKDFITENRLRAVISKEPSLLGHQSAVEKLAALLAEDAREDFEKQYADEMQALAADGAAAARKKLQRSARAFVEARISEIREDVG